jgi:oxygen-independent coproporphyrinogen-3 oxidase
MMQAPFSVYVHVPFCAQKCPYCDFNTYAVEKAPESEYVAAVCKELEGYGTRGVFAGRSVRTIFFGGGTPSLFSGESIRTIVQCIATQFGIDSDAEITLEANPNHADADRLPAFRDAGVNRISFGVQSFHEKYLQLLGRNHSVDEARQAVVRAHDAGIHDISVDLIYGVPGQSLSELTSELHAACDLPITHLSTYSLTIEPGTPFFQRQERGLLRLPPDERIAEMLDFIPTELARRGLKRYEISNYAHEGRDSKHNTVYWTGGDYLGVGAGAHSYVATYSPQGMLESAERWSTLALPASYIQGVRDGASVSWREPLEPRALMFEFFYLGLRRTSGVTRSRYNELFGMAAFEHYVPVLQELAHEGFIVLDDDAITLTTRGIAVADSVFERLSG